MPQDGANNYRYPPGTPGVPDQTIESEAYNTFLDDLVMNDLNIARPIHRGGTGATTADQALINLSGEKAEQIVTNFDSHVWISGSFQSVAGATAAPNASSSFAGIVYKWGFSDTEIVVEARDLNDGTEAGRSYVRHKSAGVWGPWVEQVLSAAEVITASDERYVNVAGDTMTGYLYLPAADPVWYTQAAHKQYVDARVLKAGDTMSGLLTTQAGITSNSNINVTAGAINITGGGLVVRDAIQCTGGNYYTPHSYIANYPGPADVVFGMNGANAVLLQFLSGWYWTFNRATGDLVWILGNGHSVQLRSDGAVVSSADSCAKPSGGPWNSFSDARIKTVEDEYTQGLDAVCALRPVNYTYKGNDTGGEPVTSMDPIKAAKSREVPTAPYLNSPHYKAALDQNKYVGLIAQEVEALFPEMVTQSDGYIDGVAVADLRTLDTGPLVFALINAVKELKARVEQLEAA